MTATAPDKPASPLAVIRRYMTPAQARTATRGMDADEMATLAWTIERLPADKLPDFVKGMTTDPEL